MSGGLEFQGHASSVNSIAEALEVLDNIGLSFDSSDCLPFAMIMNDDENSYCFADDNGEPFAGDMIAQCLDEVNGRNILVCVSRKIRSTTICDKFQCVKRQILKRVVKDCLSTFYDILRKSSIEKETTFQYLKISEEKKSNEDQDGNSASIVILPSSKHRETRHERIERCSIERFKKYVRQAASKSLIIANRATIDLARPDLSYPDNDNQKF